MCVRAHATRLRALVCAYLPVCVPSAHFSREQGDVDRSAGEHQCPRAASVSRPLVPLALPPACPSWVRRPCRRDNTTVTKEDATLQQPVTRNMPGVQTLDSGLRKNEKGQRAEDSQPSRPSSETSAGSTWTGPLPPHMESSGATNCEQSEILSDLDTNNGDTKRTAIEQVGEKISSCEKKLYTGDAARRKQRRGPATPQDAKNAR